MDEATGLCPNCDAAKIKQHYDKLKATEMPVQSSQSVEIDPNFFDFGSISYESIISEEILGSQIRFIVSGEKLAEIGIAAVQQINGVNRLEYEDMEVIVTLGDSGKVDQIVMNFDAFVEYQGYDADVTYRIQYSFF